LDGRYRAELPAGTTDADSLILTLGPEKLFEGSVGELLKPWSSLHILLLVLVILLVLALFVFLLRRWSPP
jgi:hypothetical protein